MLKWLKKNAKSILLVASLVTNALGFTGVINPSDAAKAKIVIDAVGAAAP
jgi:uncharacterized membrane protein YtjA (UPF0391 family)